jgi:IS1 family transposase
MNRLPLEKRVQVLAALCEGASIRATCRMTGAAKNTVVKLLAEVGDACDEYQFANLRNLCSARIQCDEVWSFCYAKEKNLKRDLRGTLGLGDMWTWTAIDPDSKLVVSWHLGKRSRDDAWRFIRDLAERVRSAAVQITTDGFGIYNEPIETLFPRADHGTEVKVYGRIPFESADTKYSPMVVTDVIRTSVWGAPDPDHITTAHVERNNLTMRMHIRRFTRLTNAFSKKAQNHQRAIALHFMYYNFIKRHAAVKTTPAIAAGVTDRIWTLHDLARLPDVLRDSEAA